jgi:LysM repeat protein
MRKTILIFFFAILLFGCRTTRVPTTTVPAGRSDYIDRYKSLAIEEMKRSGIPASITMAQAILESNSGTSTLARQANNHFGIKCHSDWNGKTFMYDDDRRNECFRKYQAPEESFRDHTDFLMGSSRYSELFRYDVTDYKKWAYGLKKAGYATDNTYAERIIRVIEENNLSVLDRGQTIVTPAMNTAVKAENNELAEPPYQENDAEFTVSLASRKILQRNRIDYVLVKEGDTFFSLAKECNLMLWEIYRYNDLPRNAVLKVGQLLYIQPKRNAAETGHDYHEVKEGETMYSISQYYGIKQSSLYRMNLMNEDEEPAPGTVLNLRKAKIAPGDGEKQ